MADWISEAGGSVRQAHQENAGIITKVLTGIMITIALIIVLKFIKSFFPQSQSTQSNGFTANASSGGSGLFGGGGGLLSTIVRSPLVNPLALVGKVASIGSGGGGLFKF